MKYEVFGGNLPAALVHLRAGETIWCEKGGMSWMDDEITMETQGGGIGKMFGRALSGESMFRNRYTARADGEICFASSFPGEIRGFEITPGNGIIAQKHSFLCCDEGVDMSVFFQKKVGAGFFGGEGFIMQKYEGNGTVLIEIDGSAKEYYLEAGDSKIVDTGHLVMMDATCSIDIQMAARDCSIPLSEDPGGFFCRQCRSTVRQWFCISLCRKTANNTDMRTTL